MIVPIIKNFTSQVRFIQNLTDDVFELVLTLKNPPEIDFKAGQYVTIRIPNEENRILFRAYSIASSPLEKNQIVLCIKCAEKGLGSFRLRNLRAGDYLSFRGPIGDFVLKEESSRDILLVAGGTGVAPFVSMADYLIESKSPRKMTLYFGTKTREDLFYYEKFLAMVSQYENFEFFPCLSREEKADKKFQKGRVTTVLAEQFFDSTNLEAYICGGSEFINDVKNLLKEKGFEEQHIHYEKFY